MSWIDAPPKLSLFAIVFALFAAERLLELAINQRNSRILSQRGAIWRADDGFRLILASQLVLFILLPAEVLASSWATTGWWTWPLVGVVVLAQGLRYWVILTLGERWSIRVVTVPGAERIVRGPYRFIRHPNYLAVMAEAVALPLAFGALGTALVMAPLAAVALARRIRKEDEALRDAAPGPRGDQAARRE